MQSPAQNNNQNIINRLSVLIHQDGLSFYIHTSSEVISVFNKSFKHASNPIEILTAVKDCFEKEESLKADFESVKLIYHHDIFTLVPSDIYQEENAADYLKYNTRLLQTDTVSVDENLPAINANLVYVAYSNVNNFFYDRYGDYSYFHYSTLCLPVLNTRPDGVFIEVMPSHFYLTIFSDGILVAHNLFQHEQVEDILFYTLFAAEQNQLDPETVHLTIIQPEINQQLFNLLYTYVRHVAYIDDYPKYLQTLLCA
ncbi:DUF3822 family protein [Nonlabens antarcticus]|uniref:DUF3822 family protein n=1 Tax=Nonlabens antarcticus TaxID=392714 RepID=UPI001891305C|nr:DUF3822 family protein [Nonlabens antarcticus]